MQISKIMSVTHAPPSSVWLSYGDDAAGCRRFASDPGKLCHVRSTEYDLNDAFKFVCRTQREEFQNSIFNANCPMRGSRALLITAKVLELMFPLGLMN
jgi:hypothetical protein